MHRRMLLSSVAIVSLVLALAGPLGGVSGATNVSVSTEAEYRQAILDLSSDPNGPHTISIAAGFTIATPGDPTYTGSEDLTIEGNGALVESSVGTTRFLDHTSAAALVVRDLTVDGFRTDGDGGAIRTAAGPLTVQGSTFQGNRAGGQGGALAIGSSGRIEQTTLAFNLADDAGGAVAGTGTGDVTVVASSVYDNEATGAGAALTVGGSLSLENSTVVGNSGASALVARDLSLTFATVAGNELSPGGDAVFGALVAPTGELRSFGSVLFNVVPGPGPTPTECVVGSTTSSYTYADDTSCGLTGTGDQQTPFLDPGFGTFPDFSGPTPTLPLKIDSFLLDEIPLAACQATGIDVDQRGEPRPGDPSRIGCDIGAYELQGTPEPPDAEDPDGAVDPDARGPVAGRPGFTG